MPKCIAAASYRGHAERRGAPRRVPRQDDAGDRRVAVGKAVPRLLLPLVFEQPQHPSNRVRARCLECFDGPMAIAVLGEDEEVRDLDFQRPCDPDERGDGRTSFAAQDLRQVPLADTRLKVEPVDRRVL